MASYLLGLSDYYTLSNNVKSTNLAILWKHFSEFALHIYKLKLAVDNFVRLRRQISAPFMLFDYYYCQENKLQNFWFFVYICVISIYPQKLANLINIEFESSYRSHQT